jgi:hypothetical protein
MTSAAAHMAKAVAMTKKIEAKANALLAPLDLEMKMMGWKPEFQSIMWNAVMLAVQKRLKDIPS